MRNIGDLPSIEGRGIEERGARFFPFLCGFLSAFLRCDRGAFLLLPLGNPHLGLCRRYSA